MWSWWDTVSQSQVVFCRNRIGQVCLCNFLIQVGWKIIQLPILHTIYCCGKLNKQHPPPVSCCKRNQRHEPKSDLVTASVLYELVKAVCAAKRAALIMLMSHRGISGFDMKAFWCDCTPLIRHDLSRRVISLLTLASCFLEETSVFQKFWNSQLQYLTFPFSAAGVSFSNVLCQSIS